MTTNELVSLISAKLHLPKALVRRLFKKLVSTAIREIRTGAVFVLPGIGRLIKGYRKARSGSNAQTGEPIQIKAKTVVRFRVARSFDDSFGNLSAETFVAEKDFKRDRRRNRAFARGLGPRKFPSAQVWKAYQPGYKKADYKKDHELHLGSPPLTRQAPAVAISRKKLRHEVVRIFYATDRNEVPGERLRFGSRRNASGMLSLGTCDVSIPHTHKVGNIERPPSILRIEFRENPDKHFVIQDVTKKTADEFYAELSLCVQKYARKEVLVFIHGFKVSFDDAVYRTAQISYDLDFKGAPILYSWPSNGKLYDYTPDLNNNDNTVYNLRAFLEDLASRSGATVIHLIAHSMGNRALANALEKMSLAHPADPPQFNQIVLTAPDIDADTFTRLAKVIQSRAERITLYASTRDMALKASKRKNGSYPRAGDCSERVVVVKGVDTVDASAVDTNFIGHSYYAENRSVLTDIFSLLEGGKDPEKRFGIRLVKAAPPYWRFAP
jgi:esterase/lipase superfamily enzyme/nucleoid DNA-binding protein